MSAPIVQQFGLDGLVNSALGAAGVTLGANALVASAAAVVTVVALN